MILLHSISAEKPTSNYNLPEEIAASTGLLSFDGIYRNVYEQRELLRGRGGILFVVGGWVGGDNQADVERNGQPFEKMCTWDEIGELASIMIAEIGWHTITHPDLTKVDDVQLEMEVRPPFPMRHFAYPYGKFDERVIEAVKRAGFECAWTAGRGDGTAYQKQRRHL